MIRGLALLLFLLGLLAMLPGAGAAPSAADDASRIKAEALLDPVLRRHDPAAPAGEPPKEPVAAADEIAMPAHDAASRHPSQPQLAAPARRQGGPAQARAPPKGNVQA